MGNNNQNAYSMSILDMSQRLSAIYTNGALNTDYNINTLIKVKKVLFGPDNLRMLLIQPIYSPTIKKRCVLMSPGFGDNFGTWYFTNRYAIDLALRGYIVAFFENCGSTNANLNNSGKNTDVYFKDKVINVCNVSPNNTARDQFFSAMFINLFISNEARKYVVTNSNALQIDTTRFFLAGGSLGANTALFYGYGSNNNWSTNSYYSCVKSKLNYTGAISNNGVKGILSIGGGLPAPTEALGNIITSVDNIPCISFAGAGDPLVNPNKSNFLGPELWGELAYKNILQSNNIKYNMYLNCYGVHAFEAPSYDDMATGTWPQTLPSNTISGNTNPPYNTNLTNTQVTNFVNSNLQNLFYYQYTQFQSYQALYATASYFNNIINNTIPANVLNYIKPNTIQNSPFYKYSIGTYTLEQAVAGFYICDINNSFCLFAGGHEVDNTAKNNIDATFVTSSACNTLPDNFNVISYILSAFGINVNLTNTNNNNVLSRERNDTKSQDKDQIIEPNMFEVKLLDNKLINIYVPNSIQNKQGEISLYNLLGSVVSEKIQFIADAGGYYVKDISSILQSLPSGVYLCTVHVENELKTTKFYINK